MTVTKSGVLVLPINVPRATSYRAEGRDGTLNGPQEPRMTNTLDNLPSKGPGRNQLVVEGLDLSHIRPPELPDSILDQRDALERMDDRSPEYREAASALHQSLLRNGTPPYFSPVFLENRGHLDPDDPASGFYDHPHAAQDLIAWTWGLTGPASRLPTQQGTYRLRVYSMGIDIPVKMGSTQMVHECPKGYATPLYRYMRERGFDSFAGDAIRAHLKHLSDRARFHCLTSEGRPLMVKHHPVPSKMTPEELQEHLDTLGAWLDEIYTTRPRGPFWDGLSQST